VLKDLVLRCDFVCLQLEHTFFSAMAKFDPEKNNNKNESEKDLVMYENKIGLSDDMKRLGMSSFFCDVKFLVGKSREPIYGVKAVLASRSRFTIFMQIFRKRIS